MQPDAAILERVRAVPEGFVASYGDVSPGAPRRAGAALAACRDPRVPWWRIVRADGSLTQGARQRALLVAEGVPMRGARADVGAARLPPGALRELIAGACDDGGDVDPA